MYPSIFSPGKRICVHVYLPTHVDIYGFPDGAGGIKNPSASAGDLKRHDFDPWIGKIPWRRAWQPTPVFLPGESDGQRSLAGYGS